MTEYNSDLIYQGESGALNESFSDIMATAREMTYAEVGQPGTCSPGEVLCPDWLIGEDFDLNGDGFRNMADPEADGHPAHYSERYTGTSDNGGVHWNSGIPNHAFYLLATGGENANCPGAGYCGGTGVTAIGIDDAAEIFFLGIAIGLWPDATMCDARAATEAAAVTIFGDSQTPQPPQLTATTNAWIAVGLTDTECGIGDPDTTPPAAPTGLAATAGDGIVMLNWNDNGEGDLASYKVYRSTTTGEPYTLVKTIIGASAYDDDGVANGTTYYYVVSAVDASDNESALSDEVSATPVGGGEVAVSMHIEAILLSTVNTGQGKKQGKAEVTVLDNLGNPVSGETVTGHFTVDFEGDDGDGGVSTDVNGVATFITVGTIKGKLDFGFCVDGVTGPLTLDPHTCATF